jgi:hypothetical protein
MHKKLLVMVQNNSMKFFKMFGMVSVLALALSFSLMVIPDYLRGPKNVSLIPLINNSWYYHAKKIRTRGFLKLDFESYHLHLDKESYQQGLFNYVWLKLDKKQMIEFKALDMQYVDVEGTYDATRGGKSFQGIGSIRVSKLQRIQSFQ